MSTEPPAVSRHSNENKSVNSAEPEIREVQQNGPSTEERIADKVREFAMAYPVREGLPVASDDGTEIRADYAEVEREEWRENQPDAPEFEVRPAARGHDTVDVSARKWGVAVRRLLEKYARTEKTTVNLEKADWRNPAEHETFSVEARNRWFAEYQKKYNAQIDAWLRELVGGERPSGGETEATFENPSIAMLTRSASSKPDGERVSPVEHANQLQDSWEPTYHTLRNTLRSLGHELGEDWQYIRVVEPHRAKRGDGRGINACYPHEHIILVVDGDVSATDLRPIIEKHVEVCDWAGESAHGGDAIEVREPDELNDVAAYVSDYCSIEPVGLWEREPSYLGFAAAMDAGNMRTFSRSEAAREAAKADACRQRAESDKAEQEATHGESVRREPSGEVVCAECGCSHDVQQDSTLTAHRTGQVATDGGGRTEMLRQRWTDADAAAMVGGPTAERDGERVSDGNTLEGRRLRLGGGEDWCPACWTVNPEGECPHEDYDSHPVVAGKWDSDKVVEVPSDEYQGNGHVPFEYEEPPSDSPTTQRERRVEAELERTPDASATEIVGRLGLSPDAREFVEEVRAGVDRSEPVAFDDSVPEWRVKSVTVDGEERMASAGSGVEMVALMGESSRWRPPHDGGRGCPACGSDTVVSAREARAVYHRSVAGEYWCADCGTELGAMDGPAEPPERRGAGQ